MYLAIFPLACIQSMEAKGNAERREWNIVNKSVEKLFICCSRKAKTGCTNEEAKDVVIKRLLYFCDANIDAKYAYRELILLSTVKHPNVSVNWISRFTRLKLKLLQLISLYDVLIPQGDLMGNLNTFNQLYIVRWDTFWRKNKKRIYDYLSCSEI